MKLITQKILSHKKTFSLLLGAVLLLLLRAEGCLGEPSPENTPVTVVNQSSVSVKCLIYSDDETPVFMLSPGETTSLTLSPSKTGYTFVAKPMEDWLSFARAKRDSLVAKLATAKESGNAEDIASIIQELQIVKDRIARLEENGGKSSCNGPVVGLSQYIKIIDGLRDYSISAICHE